MAKKALKLQSPQEAVQGKLSILLYGPPGSGKSTFASTFPGPYYIVPSIASSELRTLEGLGFENNVVLFESINELADQVMALAQEIKAGNLPDCHTIVFDNLTSAQLMAEQELLEKKAGKNQLEWEDWNTLSKLWKTLLAILHDLPIIMIWVTHTQIREITPPGVGQQSYTVGEPSLTGKMRTIIPSHCDFMIYCDALDRGLGIPKAFYVYLKQKDIWTARARGNQTAIKHLPDYIGGISKKGGKPVDPHYDDLAHLFGWQSLADVEGWEDEEG